MRQFSQWRKGTCYVNLASCCFRHSVRRNSETKPLASLLVRQSIKVHAEKRTLHCCDVRRSGCGSLTVFFRCFVTQFPGELPHAQRHAVRLWTPRPLWQPQIRVRTCAVTSVRKHSVSCLVHISAHWSLIISASKRSNHSTQTQKNSTRAQILPRRCVHADAEATSPHVSVVQPHSNSSRIGHRPHANVDEPWTFVVTRGQPEHAQIRHCCSRPWHGHDLRQALHSRVHF